MTPLFLICAVFDQYQPTSKKLSNDTPVAIIGVRGTDCYGGIGLYMRQPRP